jgi:outer membrane protein
LADFGERAANVEMAMMALYAAGWETQWSIQSVMAQVLENGYLTHLAQDTLEALDASLVDAKKMVDIAETLNRAGLNPVSDVYSSKAALAQIQIDVTRQRSQLEIQRAALATTLGFEPDICLRLTSLNALNVPQRSLVELLAIAKCQRQDLLAKRAKLAEAQANQKKVEASYKPKMTLNGAGGGDHAFHDKASGAHYRIALNFDAPLFTGFEAMYQKRMAFAEVKISSEELYKLELDIALEVFTQSKTVEAAKEMLYFAKDNLENAQAAYSGSLEKYNAGKERIAEVSITLRQLVNARVRYSEINSGYLIAIANLAFATGTLSPYTEFPCAKN